MRWMSTMVIPSILMRVGKEEMIIGQLLKFSMINNI
jgi:hypothetical protein